MRQSAETNEIYIFSFSWHVRLSNETFNIGQLYKRLKVIKDDEGVKCMWWGVVTKVTSLGSGAEMPYQTAASEASSLEKERGGGGAAGG